MSSFASGGHFDHEAADAELDAAFDSDSDDADSATPAAGAAPGSSLSETSLPSYLLPQVGELDARGAGASGRPSAVAGEEAADAHGKPSAAARGVLAGDGPARAGERTVGHPDGQIPVPTSESVAGAGRGDGDGSGGSNSAAAASGAPMPGAFVSGGSAQAATVEEMFGLPPPPPVGAVGRVTGDGGGIDGAAASTQPRTRDHARDHARDPARDAARDPAGDPTGHRAGGQAHDAAGAAPEQAGLARSRSSTAASALSRSSGAANWHLAQMEHANAAVLRAHEARLQRMRERSETGAVDAGAEASLRYQLEKAMRLNAQMAAQGMQRESMRAAPVAARVRASRQKLMKKLLARAAERHSRGGRERRASSASEAEEGSPWVPLFAAALTVGVEEREAETTAAAQSVDIAIAQSLVASLRAASAERGGVPIPHDEYDKPEVYDGLKLDEPRLQHLILIVLKSRPYTADGSYLRHSFGDILTLFATAMRLVYGEEGRREWCPSAFARSGDARPPSDLSASDTSPAFAVSRRETASGSVGDGYARMDDDGDDVAAEEGEAGSLPLASQLVLQLLVKDLQEFTALMGRAFLTRFAPLGGKEGCNLLREAINEAIMAHLYDDIFGLFLLAFADDDAKTNAAVGACASISAASLGVKAKFRLDGSYVVRRKRERPPSEGAWGAGIDDAVARVKGVATATTPVPGCDSNEGDAEDMSIVFANDQLRGRLQARDPWEAALTALRQLPLCRTPLSKARCLKATVDAIYASVQTFYEGIVPAEDIGAMGGDEIVPLMTFMVAHAGVKMLSSELAFMAALLPRHVQTRTELGYTLTTAQVAVQRLRALVRSGEVGPWLSRSAPGATGGAGWGASASAAEP